MNYFLFFHKDLLVSKENSSNSFKVDIVFFFIAEVSDGELHYGELHTNLENSE